MHPIKTGPRPLKPMGLLTLQDCDWMPHESVALGLMNVAVFAMETPLVGDTTELGGHVMTGGATSTTLNGKVHVLTLFALSVAVHVTLVVVCTRKRVTPESGHTSVLIPEPSVAETLEAKNTRGSGRLSLGCVV